ncbi:PilW family protein [Massilia suwonensis]|uniref:PilW family protein n=1 Tax=Massilia suwonensis TaxID=648895 RepID=A0ABW0MIQ2_9BURK
MSLRLPARVQGLSLVELLIGLAITALVMAPLVPMLQTASAAAGVGQEQIALQRDADFVLERIASRIRATPPSTTLAGKPSGDWLKPAVYSVNNGVLVEQQGKESYVLAESVTAFELSTPVNDSAQPLIKVSLSMARGGSSTSAVATVRMGTAQ